MQIVIPDPVDWPGWAQVVSAVAAWYGVAGVVVRLLREETDLFNTGAADGLTAEDVAKINASLCWVFSPVIGTALALLAGLAAVLFGSVVAVWLLAWPLSFGAAPPPWWLFARKETPRDG